MKKIEFCGFVGIVMGGAATLFGGFSADFISLGILMAVDFVLGVLLAVVFRASAKTDGGAYDSRAGFRGLCKKGVTLLLVLMAHRLDLAIGTTYIRTATIIGFSVNECVSILENAGLMGVPLPRALTRGIELLKEREEV